MAKLAQHWTRVEGEYAREDGTRLVRNRHASGVAWWVHVAGHETPLQLKGQPHLRRAWSTPLAAMRAANAEFPPGAPRRPPAPSAGGARRPPRQPVATATRADPFLFLGHGFGTSAKCLECYLWFARPPDRSRQAAIVALLPRPVAVFTHFRGEVLHFGSDDDLEARVVAAHRPGPAATGQAPRRAEWRRFCDDFERAARAIDRLCPLIAVVKPDDGAYGKRLSPWHQRSARDAGVLAARGARGPQSSVLAFLAFNLLEDLVPSWNAARRLDAPSRAAWLRWLDALLARRDRQLAEEFLERASWLYATAPDETRGSLLEALRPATRRKILAATARWKP